MELTNDNNIILVESKNNQDTQPIIICENVDFVQPSPQFKNSSLNQPEFISKENTNEDNPYNVEMPLEGFNTSGKTQRSSRSRVKMSKQDIANNPYNIVDEISVDKDDPILNQMLKDKRRQEKSFDDSRPSKPQPNKSATFCSKCIIF